MYKIRHMCKKINNKSTYSVQVTNCLNIPYNIYDTMLMSEINDIRITHNLEPKEEKSSTLIDPDPDSNPDSNPDSSPNSVSDPNSISDPDPISALCFV